MSSKLSSYDNHTQILIVKIMIIMWITIITHTGSPEDVPLAAF